MKTLIQDYLVKATNGTTQIDVLYPMIGDAWKNARNPPTCELGVVLVEIFGRWPSTG